MREKEAGTEILMLLTEKQEETLYLFFSLTWQHKNIKNICTWTESTVLVNQVSQKKWSSNDPVPLIPSFFPSPHGAVKPSHTSK
jgi:hypothetical protein